MLGLGSFAPRCFEQAPVPAGDGEVRERAEPLLQLRCIAANGDWDAFIAWVHAQLQEKASGERTTPTILRRTPGPLLAVTKPPTRKAA